MLVFSGTIHVFHQNDAFLLIVTEKPADFCGTLQKPIDTYNDKQNASPKRLTFCHISVNSLLRRELVYTHVSILIARIQEC